MIKKTDHRDLAERFEWYFKNEKIQGLPIFLEDWVFIRRRIEELICCEWEKWGFKEVMTPILADKEMYERSGHLEHYKNFMFPEIEKTNEIYYLRPMTCPHHCLIFARKNRSYRELPLRLAENSLLFRYESSGSLKGLERTRAMELVDQHVFVSLEGLKEEIKRNFFFIKSILAKFDFLIEKITCCLHDKKQQEKYHSDYTMWENSERIIVESLNEMNLNFISEAGEAAFYGPKIDLEVKSSNGKYLTISTIQIDFLLPKKFNLTYLDNEQKKKNPIIIHQSPIGTYQRFISVLLEKQGGKLPIWIVPCQVVILTLNNQKEIEKFSSKIKNDLEREKIRVKILSEKSLNYRIRETYKKLIPFYFLIGNEEIGRKIIKLQKVYEQTEESIEIEFLAKKIKEYIENSRNKE